MQGLPSVCLALIINAVKYHPDNNRARHDANTPCGSRVQTRMQQSRVHSSKGVRGISVRRICVAVRDHSCKHASSSNETHRKWRYIKFNTLNAQRELVEFLSGPKFVISCLSSALLQKKNTIRFMKASKWQMQ